MLIPANCVLQAVIAPEQFTTTDNKGRGAEYTEFSSAIGLGFPKLLDVLASY